MKTCGTTTLLRCVATLLKAALEEQGLVLEWMGYSRKNFTFPGDQLFPHSSFQQELQYLGAHAHLEKRLDGAGMYMYLEFETAVQSTGDLTLSQQVVGGMCRAYQVDR